MKHLLLIIATLIIKLSVAQLSPGKYELRLQLSSAELPVRLELYTGKDTSLKIYNAAEDIYAEYVMLTKDSINFKLPVFNTYFKAKIDTKTSFSGVYYNAAREIISEIPFTAKIDEIKEDQVVTDVLSGKWECTFSDSTSDSYKAIGLFKQNNNVITGTFITETGDYRFLEGKIQTDNSFYLSCYDGSHAFLFSGKYNNGKIEGRFYSGKTWSEPWKAIKNDNFELKDPYALTYLKEGNEKLNFSFPNMNGKQVSLEDPKYKGKIVIIQIMGTWCPNCLDESKYYTALYNNYRQKGLEIIALAYEHKPTLEFAKPRIEKLINNIGAKYEFLLAGSSNKEEAAKSLPMLNHIMSFPTSVFIDKKGRIRKIHTGYYGPSTGIYHEKYTNETELFIQKLLAE